MFGKKKRINKPVAIKVIDADTCANLEKDKIFNTIELMVTMQSSGKLLAFVSKLLYPYLYLTIKKSQRRKELY